jgi:hypothetical protein
MSALRQHAGHTLTRMGAQLLDSGESKPGSVIDMVARVRAMVQPAAAAE